MYHLFLRCSSPLHLLKGEALGEETPTAKGSLIKAEDFVGEGERASGCPLSRPMDTYDCSGSGKTFGFNEFLVIDRPEVQCL